MLALSRHLAAWAKPVRCRLSACSSGTVSALRAQSRSSKFASDHEPWVVPTSTPDFESSAAESILNHGFVILPKLFERDGLEVLKRPVEKHVSKVESLLRAKSAKMDVGSANGFHEVCLRSPGRVDIPCNADQLHDSVVRPLQSIADQVLSESTRQDAEEAEKKAKCAFMGMVRAEPGCPEQLWHSDSPHVTGPHHGPPNMLNMLVSLEDVPVELGPTEVVPGSHVLSNHLRPESEFEEHTLVYQQPGNSPELIGAEESPVKAEMAAGSVLIFDDRVLHRGGGNQSMEKNRDIVFLSYHRADYSTPTYYEAQRSLLTYDHKALAKTVRTEFPGLAKSGGSCSSPGSSSKGKPTVIMADGASGSQFHKSVIDGMVEQMTNGIANMGGNYDTSRRAEETMISMRAAMADFLNCGAEEIVLGASMSALTYHVGKALRNSKHVRPGDNVVLDPMSHGANVWTWVQLAKECDAEIRWFTPGDGLVLSSDREVLSGLFDENTRLVATGYASNGVGSIHDVKAICEAAKDVSKGRAITYVDAVHYAPHGRVDVQDIACDFLVCSPYKFFGPHSGILYGRSQLLKTLSADRLDCQDDGLPNDENCHMSRWEVGTQNYEAAAGIAAAVDYLASLGNRFGGADEGSSRANRLDCAWRAIGAHESELKACFLEGAAKVKGLHLVGVTDQASELKRTATFAVAKDGLTAEQLTNALCDRNIWCTYGNHYAGFWSEHSGGVAHNDVGMTRLGFLHYNTIDEVQEVIRVLADL